MSTDKNPSGETKYYDIVTRGVGYLGNARTVNPENGDKYPAININALQGPKDNVRYRKFQCSVKGSQAKEVIKNYLSEINGNTDKVVCGFVVGDPQPRSWTNKETGEMHHVFQGKLIGIDWVSINGKRVFTREKTAMNGKARAAGDSQPGGMAAAQGQQSQQAASGSAWSD